MSNVHTTLSSLFEDIADEIRLKKGTTSQIVADDFPDEIASIHSDAVIDPLTITPNTTQQVFEAEDIDGYSPVTVNAVTKELLAQLDTDFKAENIKKDVDILGLVGTFAGGGGGSVNAKAWDITFATALSSGRRVILNSDDWITSHKDDPNVVVAMFITSSLVDNRNKAKLGFVQSRIGTTIYNVTGKKYIYSVNISNGSTGIVSGDAGSARALDTYSLTGAGIQLEPDTNNVLAFGTSSSMYVAGATYRLVIAAPEIENAEE